MIFVEDILKHKYKITQPAELDALIEIRDFIQAAYAKHPQVEEDARYDILLAVEEACANIIEHGYSGMHPGEIVLDLEFRPDKVVVCITDFGHSFDPTQAPVPNIYASLDERPVGGLGVYIIQQIMDDYHYRSSPDGNSLCLTKRNGSDNSRSINHS